MAILFYLVISLYFGRKNPLFYLLLPYALQQGTAAFINQSLTIAGKRPFSTFDSLFTDTLFLLTTFIAIFLVRAKWPSKSFWGSRLVTFYLVFLLLLSLISLFTYYDPNEVLLTARQFLYIPLSFFLWLSIFSVVTREQYEQFLKFFFIITPISAILYILNSSGTLSIFDKENLYREIEGGSTTFFRDFSTIPTQLAPVLIISVISLIVPTFKIPKWLILVNIIILPIAVLFTFTRGILVAIIFMIVVILFLYSYANSKKMFSRVATFLIIIMLFFIPTFFVAQKIYPDAVDYFTERITNTVADKGEEQNIDIRASYLDKAIELTNNSNVLTGVGFNRKYYPQMDAIGAWIADSTIPTFLYHTGWLGVLILYLIIFYFIFDSIRFFKKTNDWLVAFLCASFINSAFSTLLMGGGVFTPSVWTFMNLALYTTIRVNSWREQNEIEYEE